MGVLRVILGAFLGRRWVRLEGLEGLRLPRRCRWGCGGSLLGVHWVVLGASRGALGSLLGHPGAVWGRPGRVCGCFGQTWGRLRPSWGRPIAAREARHVPRSFPWGTRSPPRGCRDCFYFQEPGLPVGLGLQFINRYPCFLTDSQAYDTSVASVGSFSAGS